ncbi:MAG: glycosyltransferase family 2 protein [Flavobacteriales bacterium]
MKPTLDLSLVIPLYNEEESLPELCDWIARVCEGKYDYEIVLVDDGSKDRSWEVIEQLAEKNTRIKGIRFRRNYGKSAGLDVGFETAQGRVVITMDADLQDSPEEIPELVRMIDEEKFDLVSGWKKKRFDPITKTIPTKLFNWATRRMSGIKLHDFNCGLKAYRFEVIKNIEVMGEMHRYIPVIAKWAGFSKIGEKPVIHQARKYGKSKFGIERFINGFLDLFTITFVSRFGKKPMHFFGLLGTLMFVIGFFITLWLGIDKLFINVQGERLTEKPLFFISLTTMILGTILFVSGFLAELIVRNSPDRGKYLISDRLNN